MIISAWKRARMRIGLPQVRVHDLKHTFGRRLRAAGISFDDRQDLLGHRSGRITTHYSAAELSRLIAAADSVARTTRANPSWWSSAARSTGGHARLTQALARAVALNGQGLEINGEPGWDRTNDHLIKSQMLYR